MQARSKALCIVEDDPIMGEALRDRLELEGFVVDWLRTAGSARVAIAGNRYDMLICDDRLPDGTGGELFAALNEATPALPPTVFITGFGSIDRAVALLKLGAMDYVTKPFDIEDLLGKINTHCQPDASPSEKRAPVLGVSRVMRDLEATLHRIAPYTPHTLITGESGVGKEEVAKRLHALAFPGQVRPFIAVNCGAIPDTLLESELFGHERGAFTGAVESQTRRLRASQRRHSVLRRSREHAARYAGKAAQSAPGPTGGARRQRATQGGRISARLRDEP